MRGVPTIDGKRNRRVARPGKLTGLDGKHVTMPSLSDVPLVVKAVRTSEMNNNFVREPVGIQLAFKWRGAEYEIGWFNVKAAILPKMVVLGVAKGLASLLQTDGRRRTVIRALESAWTKSPALNGWMAEVLKSATVAEIMMS